VNSNFIIKLKDNLTSLRINLNGKKLSKKYIIIESDDWGAIRTPSKEVLNKYIKNNVVLDDSIYKYDSLETEKDLERLFDVLNSVKDINGNPAIFTTNTILANPDFEKIKASNFDKYYYEPFIETYAKYPNTNNNIKLLKQGISEKLILPQFHGREHINVNRWLKDLRNGSKGTMLSFSLNSTFSCFGDYSYMEAFDWDMPEEIETHKTILNEGLKLFEQIFNFSSVSFIPPCYNLDPRLYEFLFNSGVRILQGMRVQLVPTGQFNEYKKEPHTFWEKDTSGLRFNIRNTHFEPVLNENKDWINRCLQDISNAFLFNKPAIISSHRINYISSISEQNGKKGLADLKKLLKEILKRWPDIEFVSTADLLKLNQVQE